MAGVNQSNGSIDNKYFDVLKNWNRKYTLQDALKGIRKEMESSAFKKLSQPEEGKTF
jgi:ubiquitin-conjugating enzyme E2 variant